MERAHRQPAGLPAEQFFHPAVHLTGGFVGEGDRQNVVGAHPQIANQVGDAVGQDARLAGTGAGKHDDGAQSGGDGLLLLHVETCQ